MIRPGSKQDRSSQQCRYLNVYDNFPGLRQSFNIFSPLIYSNIYVVQYTVAVKPVMTQVWCGLVYCIFRSVSGIWFCTAKHTFSVSVSSCSCGRSTVSPGVSQRGGQFAPQFRQNREKRTHKNTSTKEASKLSSTKSQDPKKVWNGMEYLYLNLRT